MTSSSGAAPEPPRFYGPLAEKLSQGDLVRVLPWGVVDAPLTICRPQGGTRAAYNPATAVPSAFKKGREAIHASGAVSVGMVLWHDCEIDKGMNQGKPVEKWFTAVAPVLPISNFNRPSDQDGLRLGRRRMYFYVPENAPLDVPEGYVDLRYVGR
jgi:hypothetical protein